MTKHHWLVLKTTQQLFIVARNVPVANITLKKLG
jgi:hypothetical protein